METIYRKVITSDRLPINIPIRKYFTNLGERYFLGSFQLLPHDYMNGLQVDWWLEEIVLPKNTLKTR